MPKLPSYIDKSHERFTSYIDNRQLFKGRAFKIFAQDQYLYYKYHNPKKPELTYINFNFFKIVSKIQKNLLFRETPDVTFSEDGAKDWFDEWAKKRKFFNILQKGFERGTYDKGAVYKMNYFETRPNSQEYYVGVTLINPEFWFPKLDPMNPEGDPLSHTIMIQKEFRDEKGEISKKAYLLEIHEYGQIVFQSFVSDIKKPEDSIFVSPDIHFKEEMSKMRIDERRKSAETGAPEFVSKTGVDLPLVIYIPNIESDDYFGQDDYDDIKPLNYALNKRLNQIDSVLDKHADPSMIVPEGTIKAAIDKIIKRRTKKSTPSGSSAQPSGLSLQLSSGLTGFVNSNDVNKYEVVAELQSSKYIEFPTDGSQAKPEYVTWNGNLDAAFRHVEMLMDMMFEVSHISPIFLQPDTAIGNLSGRALKMLLKTTLDLVATKAEIYQSKVQDMIYIILKMYEEAGKNNFTLEKTKAAAPKPDGMTIDVEFQDGLPNDLQEIVNIIQGALDTKVISQMMAIEMFNNVSTKRAEEIKSDIDEEAEQNQLNFLRLQAPGQDQVNPDQQTVTEPNNEQTGV